MKIKNSKKQAAYINIYESLKTKIISGRIQFSEKLPSKRQLCDDFGVSVITIEHALELLIDEGYIEAKERSGYYAIYREDALQGVLQKSTASDKLSEFNFENTVPFNLGQKPNIKSVANFNVLSKIMRRVINEYGEEILVKSPGYGIPKLRKAIADYLYKNRNLRVDPKQIIIGAGSEYLYGIIVKLLGGKLKYAVEDPCYEKIQKVYEASGVKIIKLPLGEKGIQSKALWKKDFDVLHVSPYRSFPSGVSADASKRNEYIQWAGKRLGRYIVEDDFESEFFPSSKPADTLFSAADGDNVIYLNTFSKTISPAIRAGYMVLPKSLLKTYDERVGFYSCAVPTFEQYVLAEYIASGEFLRNINRTRRKL